MPTAIPLLFFHAGIKEKPMVTLLFLDTPCQTLQDNLKSLLLDFSQMLSISVGPK
jgi:hypothetical protein